MIADHMTGIAEFEAGLWKIADNLRANSNLASNEYFMPIMGLLFLRQASNRYYAALEAIEADKQAGKMPDRDPVAADFTRRRALMLPQAARYDRILQTPKDGNLGAALTAAMEEVERSFPPLAGQLPKDYGRFDGEVLENMMRTFDTEALRKASGDVFGRIYEYFLAEFSKQGAHDNGEFYTPPSIVQTIVNVIEPDHGVVLDPACGTGGMFVQSSHFIERAGQDTMKRVTFFGHEKNETTAKLAQINLAVNGLEGRIRAGNEAITYYKVCFVNGLPLVFIELKAVYKNIRAGFDGNLRDYMDEHVIAHAFHHNAFLVVSNGDNARYGSITSLWEHFHEWKRHGEKDKGSVAAQTLLDGMLAHDRLLDIVENFILFDESKPGATRKVVARNHQVLGVNQAVASVARQEALKRQFPPGERLRHRVVELPLEREPRARLKTGSKAEPATELLAAEPLPSPFIPQGPLHIVERAHADLGRLGVFWHTQGSGKSYSMAFFAEKVRRKLPGNFTFLLMTDRDDLDDQIYGTFVGCGIASDETPRAASCANLEKLLKQNHRYVFSLIHKFNQDVLPEEPYSERDDIIVISDEAHRTQAGRLARNMRLALPNAAFIGFTGTPLFKQDQITRRIFGDYVSRYDFKRAEEDGATVKLVYENRGEKLGVAKADLNDRIAEKIEAAELDADQAALLDKLLGKDYEIITADERLDKIAADFVEHCATRWQSGKVLFVCIDKITCARMHQRIVPRWEAKTDAVRAAAQAAALAGRGVEAAKLAAQAAWLDETIVELVISEAQNEVADFRKWGFDIIPHRALMKQGFDAPDGKRVDVETAFKDPQHAFRVAIVCAMWLTGFDVESLSTLYIDKPMRAHTLMQAIARANRVYPGKDFGLIVDYNGMLKSLREALAQYALGDDGSSDGDIIAPVEERVQALLEAVEATEFHLRGLGFDAATLIGSKGFARIAGIKDGVEAVYASDDSKRRFEILARQVFIRFRSLLMEPTAFRYAERHDNIEAIYKKLTERRDTADVTELLKELHRIVNEAIRTQAPGRDQAEGRPST